VELGDGLVLATNSSNGFELNTAVQNLWSMAVLGQQMNAYPPAGRALPLAGMIGLGIAIVFALPLLAAMIVFLIQLKRGGRRFTGINPRRLWLVLPWALLASFWWYWIYSPFKLFFPTTFPDTWPLPQTAYVMAVLLAWLAFSVLVVFSQKVRTAK